MHTFLLFIVFLSEDILRVACQKEIQPYGPKMCYSFCQREHCSKYNFDDPHLRCLLFSARPQLCPRASNGINFEVDSTASRTTTLSSKPDKNMIRSTCPSADVNRFLYFCASGNLVEVKRLVCHGIVNVDCRVMKGLRTGVMNAALNNNIDIFDFLVAQHCDLSAVDENDSSVMHYASIGNSVDIIKKLINDHNINIEQRDVEGKTPLMAALESGKMEAFKSLIESGADATAVDGEGNNILHLALEDFRKDFIEFIVSQNLVDIDSKGPDGETPMMTAIIAEKMAIVKLFLDHGADVYKRDLDNNTLLHIACTSNGDMVEYFLSLNITDIESRGHYGRTPLMVAANNLNIQGVKFLKERGANISTVDDHNNTVLHTACRNGDIQLVKYILSWNTIDIESKGEVGRTPLLAAVTVLSDTMPTVNLLRDKGADETAVDDEGRNVFHLACERGDLDMVKQLLTLEKLKGEEKRKDNAGLTPADIARQEDYTRIVEFLTDRLG